VIATGANTMLHLSWSHGSTSTNKNINYGKDLFNSLAKRLLFLTKIIFSFLRAWRKSSSVGLCVRETCADHGVSLLTDLTAYIAQVKSESILVLISLPA